MSMIDDPEVEDFLAHFGVKGMRWGVRRNDYDGATRAVNRAASKDAAEFARAKMFYGDGAGTRRKLIKAKVESASKKDPTYKQAFDHHMQTQDLGIHAKKATRERRRKNTSESVSKNARAVNRAINGPFAGPVAVTALLGAYGIAKQKGYDQVVLRSGQEFVRKYFS